MRKSVCALVCAAAAALAAPALQAAPEAVSGATVKANLQGGAMPENVDAVTSASVVPETLRQKVVPNGFTRDGNAKRVLFVVGDPRHESVEWDLVNTAAKHFMDKGIFVIMNAGWVGMGRGSVGDGIPQKAGEKSNPIWDSYMTAYKTVWDDTAGFWGVKNLGQFVNDRTPGNHDADYAEKLQKLRDVLKVSLDRNFGSSKRPSSRSTPTCSFVRSEEHVFLGSAAIGLLLFSQRLFGAVFRTSAFCFYPCLVPNN